MVSFTLVSHNGGKGIPHHLLEMVLSDTGISRNLNHSVRESRLLPKTRVHRLPATRRRNEALQGLDVLPTRESNASHAIHHVQIPNGRNRRIGFELEGPVSHKSSFCLYSRQNPPK